MLELKADSEQLMRNRLRYVIPIIYLVIFGFCFYQSSNASDIGFDWFGACMALTLPWSVVTFVLILGAIRILGDTGIAVIVAITAVLNAILLFMLFRNRKSN